MNGFKVGPVSILIGSQAYTCTKDEIYVAPIDDNLLLGLDFLQKHQAVMNISVQVFLRLVMSLMQ
jgi:hypothetical protein